MQLQQQGIPVFLSPLYLIVTAIAIFVGISSVSENNPTTIARIIPVRKATWPSFEISNSVLGDNFCLVI